MANSEYLAKLKESKEGFEDWNQWREQTRDANLHYSEVDLSEANLSGLDLSRANLNGANLRRANLNSTKLLMTDLRRADIAFADLTNADLTAAWLNLTNLQCACLRRVKLTAAHLQGVDLREVDLTGANLFMAKLSRANLRGSNLSEALLVEADLRMADVSCANLRGANLYGADLLLTNMSGSDLSEAQLGLTNLVRTNFEGANLSGCGVYGVSAWDIQLNGAIQSNLVITPDYLPTIQVDNLEVAQFVYLLLKSERIRHVIDTITSKVVLILGRFTPERKRILDAIRDGLRTRDYVPMLFDFQKPDSRDLTGTLTTLANLARFIITDLTDPSCIPYELATVVPQTKVPVQAIILEGKHEFAMFDDLRHYPWVLPPYRYQSAETLLANLSERVIAPAEVKVEELRRNL
jgi:uncharacterized protein YjbI with pentapeptide repeats